MQKFFETHNNISTSKHLKGLKEFKHFAGAFNYHFEKSSDLD